MAEWTERELMRRMDIAIRARKDFIKSYKDKYPIDTQEQLIQHEQKLRIIFNHDQEKIFTALERIEKRLKKLEKKNENKRKIK